MLTLRSQSNGLSSIPFFFFKKNFVKVHKQWKKLIAGWIAGNLGDHDDAYKNTITENMYPNVNLFIIFFLFYISFTQIIHDVSEGRPDIIYGLVRSYLWIWHLAIPPFAHRTIFLCLWNLQFTCKLRVCVFLNYKTKRSSYPFLGKRFLNTRMSLK